MDENLSDSALLAAYCEEGSQEAFGRLVGRHANLVYGTARRQVGDLHLAEDVSQAVFVILAKKAGTLARGTVLSGWLYNTTIYACANALKSQSRRKYHENKRGLMSGEIETVQEAQADWEAVSPLLDGALAKLGGRDRDAVLLKYIEGKSHREVGAAIGVSEEAARKRIARSLSRLRGFFQKRGVALSVAGVAGILSTHVAEAAPVSVLGATGIGSAGSIGVAKGTLTMIAWAKAKLVAACVAAAMVVSGGAGLAIHQMSVRAAEGRAGAPAPSVPVIPIADQAPAAPAPAAAQRIEGVVIGPDGEPLIDAEVFLATPQASVSVYANRSNAPRIITEKDGKFSFPAQGKDWVIVVMHPDGMATALAEELAASNMVLLKKWGRIEGTLYAATKPLAGETVNIGEWGMADDPLSNCVTKQTTVKTDKDGHFVLAKVAPGAPLLSHNVMTHFMQMEKWNCVEVQPGRTVTVDLGGVGRPVVGKVTVPPGWEKKLSLKLDREHFWEIDARLMAPLDPAHPAEGMPKSLSGMPIPMLWSMMTPRQQHLYREKWEHSADGIAYRRFMFAEQTTILPGGAFRFDVLRPGKYSLSVRALENIPAQNMMEDVAGAFMDITVPEPANGAKVSEEAVDVGAIVLKPSPRIIIGDPAPALSMRMVDGKVATLADFKGKYLLLHVKPAMLMNDDSEGLKKAYEKYKDDGQFVILTLQLGVDQAQAKNVAAEHKWAWPQAVGTLEKTGGVPEDYQYGPASNFLIDPEGKVVMKVLRSENVETEIAKLFLERR